MSGNVPAENKDDSWIYSACQMCYSACAIKVHRVNGVVTRIEGNPDYPHNWGRLCAKGNAAIMGLYDPFRVKHPMKRTNPEKGIGVDPGWVEISWDEALDVVTEKLKQTREKNPEKLGLCSFDLGALPFFYPWAMAYGSPNSSWVSSAYFCGAGLHLATYLTNASFHMQVDLERCNYVILFGSQMGFGVGHSPNITTQEMADARVRGLRVVVVDPVCSTAASKADEWVPIRPGTDGAMALAMLNVILNDLGTYDAEFIEKRTNGPYLVEPDGHYARDKESGKPLVWDVAAGQARLYDSPGISSMAIEGRYTVHGQPCQPAFQLLKDHVKQFTPEQASEITTVKAETIRRLATEYVNAASIGATTIVEGERLPFRPAAVHMYRGSYSHKHATHHALAVQLLNIVVGNVYVPGGHSGINAFGPWWEPREGIDGLIVADKEVQIGVPPYSFLNVPPVPPKSVNLATLFPIAFGRAPAQHLAVLEPEKYGLEGLEVLIQCRGNVMMTTVAPEEVAAALKKIPFIVAFGNFLDETAEFADVVLPDTHFLERLDPVTNETYQSHNPTAGWWYWAIRQPVVEPPQGTRHWLEVLFELADRVGFLEDFNRVLSTTVKVRKPLKLDPHKAYTWQEFADLWLKAESGDEDKGLAWFQEHGHLKFRRTLREVYPAVALKQRIPLYFEHFLTAKRYVEKVAGEMGLDWDTSDYEPLLRWRPCPAFEAKEGGYDLFVVNYTLPFQQYSITAENPWLHEITERHPYAYKIMVNTEAARQRGIRDDAAIWVETPAGRKVKGQIKVTECIHPEVVAIAGIFGAWSDSKPIAKGKGAHFNSLIPFDLEHVDMVSASADACERVRIYPA